MADATRISSTNPLAEEKQREAAQRKASEDRARSIRRNLLNAGRETATEYGRLLFREYGERVSDAIEALFLRMLRGDAPAGPHYCALPALLVFHDKGLRPAAALALGVVLDRLSRRRPYREVAMAIGREIEDEARALSIEAHDRDMLRLLKKRAGGRRREVVGQWTLQTLRLGGERWSSQDRLHVGGLLLDLVVAHTGLVRVVQQRQPAVEPTVETLALMKANPPRPVPVRRLPMLVQPRPWEGLYGGGHLDNKSAVVVTPRPLDLRYLEQADISAQLQVVNALQQQQMAIDPWMVAVQREAWDANIRGLFPVQRNPLVTPSQPDPWADKQEWADWHRKKQQAWLDQDVGKAQRMRIEEGLRQSEAVAGRPVWFAYGLDFRGRVYSSNRYVTHQGPDHDKALVSFAHGEPCGERGFEWLLMAAAGHWGLGKAKWEERLDWGKQNLDRLTAVAEAPLDRLELWRGADDPWQLLQVARAVQQWLTDPTQPIGCPVRLDQTCSGVGISAALVRDARLARLTNLTGSTRADIYQVVADRVTALLREEVELAGEVAARHALFWLDFGVDRSLAKRPVMSSIYGAHYQSLFDGLVAAIEERQGQADLRRVRQDVLNPVRYLVRILQGALKQEVGSCLALQKWLRDVSKAAVSRQQPVQWTTPMGWPMRLGAELELSVASGTTLAAMPRQQSRRRAGLEGELSARATNRGITANAIHSFDAAFCQAIVSTAAAQQVQVLTNHDCFAAVPERAEWLHGELHRQLCEMFKPSWLEQISAEIADRAGIRRLPAPPIVGDLCPGLVGVNPYAFS